MAMDSFLVSIPDAAKTEAHRKIIFDFFDLLSTIAAQAERNDFKARKLSRFAGWWAFGETSFGHGFERGYEEWLM